MDRNTYLITFACYGAWLPGRAGAVDRGHNLYRSRLPDPWQKRETHTKELMKGPAYQLDATARRIVLDSIQEVCRYRAWTLLAAHVRTNHVHVVVDADQNPEHVMNAFKAYASRDLNAVETNSHGLRRWARHGSTRYLWKPVDVAAAIEYVVREQGEPMAMFELDETTEAVP